jgi:hypothetical protein
MAAKKRGFFISFTQQDETWAKWTAKILKAEGHAVTLTGETDAPPDDAVFIILLSRAYLDSEESKAEWISAYARDKKGSERAIIPVRVENVLPEGLLSHRVFIDIFGSISDEERKRRLLAALSDEIRELQDSEYRDIADTGAPKALHNLPPPGPFSDSAAIIPEMEKHLLAGGDTRPVVILSGEAGAGKTAAALAFARKNINKYHTLWLVNAEDSDSLDLAYRQLAREKKISAAADTEAIREAVREWLENDAGHLIIFDGVEDMNLLDDYLPQEVHGGVIMTTRDRGAGAILMLENVMITL